MMQDFVRPKQLGLMEDCDGLIDIANVKKGDRFYECHHTWGNIEIVALSDAQRTSEGWTCKVRDKAHHEHEIFVSANTRHFGPNLFAKPQIIDRNEQGEPGYYVQ